MSRVHSLILAAATLGAACGERAVPPPTVTASASPAMTTSAADIDRLTGGVGRKALEICAYVDGTTLGVADDEARREIEAALARLLRESRLGALAAVPTKPMRACAVTPFHVGTGARHDSNRKPGESFPSPPRVDASAAASEVLRVVVAPTERIEFIFGSVPRRRVAEEFVCATGACREVTTALYLTVQELRDASRLAAFLAEALGAVPRT